MSYKKGERINKYVLPFNTTLDEDRSTKIKI